MLVFMIASGYPVYGAGKNPGASPPPGEEAFASMNLEGEGSTLLAVLAPIMEGEGLLITGKPRDVFGTIVEEIKSTRPALEEGQWLTEHGIGYRPVQRDPVIAPDYNPRDPAAGLVFRWDRLSTNTETLPLTIREGKAFLRGLRPGDYCLVIPGVQPLATTAYVTGPVTIVRSDSWKPLAVQYWISTLSVLDESSFQTALSPAPFAQVNPLILRMRAITDLNHVDLFLFYRGYYEGLALARWIETAPDASMVDFVSGLRVSDANIDQIVGEAMSRRQMEEDIWSRHLEALVGKIPVPTPDPSLTPEPPPIPGNIEPGLGHYRSYYYVGMATFFASEAVDRNIPASRGSYVYPGEAEMYRSQYRYMAMKCASRAEREMPKNPLLRTLSRYIEREIAP